MRIAALVTRILRQLIRDKRTLGLLIFAPILVLTMLHLVFNGDDYEPKIGIINMPAILSQQLELQGAQITYYKDAALAQQDIENLKLDAYVDFENNIPELTLEGSDPAKNGAVLKWMQQSFAPLQQTSQQLQPDISFMHGSENMSQFDYFGPVLLGFFVFFFVFLIAGVSFLRERTTGTLERLLSSPLRKWEIVIGYVLGFGIFTMIQAAVISAYAIYVLGMLMEGAFVYVLLTALALAFTALSLGILLSTFANNELQMMQFIPVIVIPQIFFSGLFNLDTISNWLSWIAPFTPLYYAANALRNIMVRGSGWEAIYPDLLMLTGFSLAMILLNIFALRKYRKI